MRKKISIAFQIMLLMVPVLTVYLKRDISRRDIKVNPIRGKKVFLGIWNLQNIQYAAHRFFNAGFAIVVNLAQSGTKTRRMFAANPNAEIFAALIAPNRNLAGKELRHALPRTVVNISRAELAIKRFLAIFAVMVFAGSPGLTRALIRAVLADATKPAFLSVKNLFALLASPNGFFAAFSIVTRFIAIHRACSVREGVAAVKASAGKVTGHMNLLSKIGLSKRVGHAT